LAFSSTLRERRDARIRKIFDFQEISTLHSLIDSRTTLSPTQLLDGATSSPLSPCGCFSEKSFDLEKKFAMVPTWGGIVNLRNLGSKKISRINFGVWNTEPGTP